MLELARHYAHVRSAHPTDRLLVVFEIDGPIVDRRHTVRRRLLDYDRVHGTNHFSGLEASSGQHNRHRLNRGGDRDLNRALHTVAITRLRCHPETRRYESKRTAQGKTHRDIRRSIKRALARRLYRRIQAATNPLQLRAGA